MAAARTGVSDCAGFAPNHNPAFAQVVQPAFRSVGIFGVSGHTFRRTVGTVLVETGECLSTALSYGFFALLRRI